MRLAPLLVSVLFLGFAAAIAAPTPPAQPATGPGGADYAYANVASHSTGEGGDDVTIFWPEKSTAENLPVIVFTHGWGAMKPEHYLAWIHHLVRHGAFVLYPRYQKSLRAPSADFTPNAVAGVKRGLEWLATQKQLPRADLTRLATVGHSAGGVLAANLVIALPAAGLPAPKAAMCVEPAVLERDGKPLVPLSDLAKIPATTLLLTLSGDRDTLVGDIGARRIYESATAVPAANKDWLELRSDDHGAPALVATHRAPAAPLPGYTPPKREEPKGFIRKRIAEKAKERLAERGLDLDSSTQEPPVTDALDYYGTWKLFDALCASAFENKFRDAALGGGPAQLDMGKWSDGTPVKPLARRSAPPAAQ
ncbi:MAG: alpha/beta hydrolase [Candidatus Didemnitutus sp.]|nr:alpha/beta hydrolase [Candidatus Didemnitutus sp.]